MPPACLPHWSDQDVDCLRLAPATGSPRPFLRGGKEWGTGLSRRESRPGSLREGREHRWLSSGCLSGDEGPGAEGTRVRSPWGWQSGGGAGSLAQPSSRPRGSSPQRLQGTGAPGLFRRQRPQREGRCSPKEPQRWKHPRDGPTNQGRRIQTPSRSARRRGLPQRHPSHSSPIPQRQERELSPARGWGWGIRPQPPGCQWASNAVSETRPRFLLRVGWATGRVWGSSVSAVTHTGAFPSSGFSSWGQGSWSLGQGSAGSNCGLDDTLRGTLP